MVWGIIGAMDIEVAILREAMTVAKEQVVYGSTYYTGTLHGQKVVLVCCSVATINAALCASVMIREMGATRIVNIGIAGGMDRSLKVLDVVISKDAGFHDTQPGVCDSFYPFTNIFTADQGLVELAVSACERLKSKGFAHKVGRVATGDVFVSSTEQKERIDARLDNPLCVEMEGAAIAQAAYMNEVPFVIIRTISDFADENADMSYEEFKVLAADHSSSIIMTMLEMA